ncbi:MAG TPA: glycoside hydrolase family 2 TIM barrel-domain containing protein [Candidatus Limnocylindrales bacterium]|nr:glycoside hydrolase family 2 TIM barrel-domain containing protein [Candidatus Limnocylindrales bacterium]
MHPSPQLRRQDWLDLSGRWGFAHDDGDIGLMQGWNDRADPFDRVIEVPYPPESRLSGIHDPDEHPVVWYRRGFRLSEVPGYSRGKKLLLKFGAVDYSACVWVNGHFLTRHEGGHSSFTVDITAALEDGDEQVLTVRAEDQPHDLTQPRGKQYWESRPADIWYHRTTGIWQPVWLEAVEATHVEHLSWTPDTRRGRVGVSVRLNREPDREMRMRLRLSIEGQVLADDTYLVQHQESGREIRLEPAAGHLHRHRLLWSPKHPNLVDAEVVLQDRHGGVIDVIQSYVGLRSVEAADGLFLLNGQPSYLRLVLAQGYWPDSHLAAPSVEALRHEVEMIKALGFNGVRIHQKVEDPRFLYWCDRLGLFVWAEMANAYAFTENAVKRLTNEWMQVVRRDYSHPSIVTWVPFNESWGVPDLPGDQAQRDFVRGIYHLTRALDPTRPVIANDGWEHLVGDIWGIHDYALDGTVIRNRYGTPEALDEALQGRPQYHRAVLDETARAGQPVVLSEFGGITFAPQPGVPWFGYGSVANEDAFLERYEDLLMAVLDSPGLAGFCYTQLADTEQETNGLLHADRTPKLDPEIVRAITSRPSRAIPGDAISAAQAASRVLAYTPSVTAEDDARRVDDEPPLTRPDASGGRQDERSAVS